MTAFHSAFAEALEGRPDALAPALAADQRTSAAMAVYRNTTVKARIDALQANYPTIAELTGDEWFRAVAAVFVAEQPGDDPVMAGFGEGFPDWLVRFEPAREYPYLPPVARLDRAWTEAHLARDAEPLRAGDVAPLGLALAGKTLALHPSTRVFWFDWTAPSLWLAHRCPDGKAGLEWCQSGEGLLIVRPGMEVTTMRLSAAAHAFLKAIRLGRPVGAAAAAAQGVSPGVNVSTILADLLAAGTFAAFNPEPFK